MKCRQSVMAFKKKYNNKGFYLTTYYDTHFHCVAINEEDITERLINRIALTNSVIKRGSTYYIF